MPRNYAINKTGIQETKVKVDKKWCGGILSDLIAFTKMSNALDHCSYKMSTVQDKTFY